MIHFLAFVAATVAADTQLIKLDREIQASMVANDRKVLRRDIAPDFRFQHSDGSVETKADVLRASAAKPRVYLRRRVVGPRAEVHGNTGFVFASLDVASGGDTAASGPVCYSLDYVHIYLKRRYRWRLVSHRTTAITKPERPCSHGH